MGRVYSVQIAECIGNGSKIAVAMVTRLLGGSTEELR
jgi:hypothetical protein